jgi:leucyl aminopeptidase (aminopeptidase T)
MASMTEAMRYAKLPIELNARPGDNVLVVADHATPQDVVDALLSAARTLGHEASVIIFEPLSGHGAEPPDAVAQAMAAADVALLTASTGMAHTDATLQAAQTGTRCVFMDELTLEMLCGGAATADYERMGRLAQTLGEKWDAGNRVRVVSRLGTDLVASIAGRRSWQMAGRAFSADWFDLSNCCAFPDGECGVAPVEGTANGTIVFDTSVQTIGRLEEPVALTVVASRIVEIQGGWQANVIRENLESVGDENAYYCPAEIAIGLNEAAQITGMLREDKKVLGSCHIAYGANSDIGGTVEARLHIDGLIHMPTIEIDDEVIVEDGVIRLEVPN